MGPVAMILVLWMLSFTFNNRLFSSYLVSAIRVVSFAYLRSLIFFPAVLIPACNSSRLAFQMMYSAYKLNKQGDSIQPWRNPFPVWNQSIVPCPVLTVASWPRYRFLRRQVGWSSSLISLRVFHILLWFTQRLQCGQWSRSRCFSEILLLFLWSNGWMLAIWSLVPLLFLNPACTSGSSWFSYCWSLAWRILSIILV